MTTSTRPGRLSRLSDKVTSLRGTLSRVQIGSLVFGRWLPGVREPSVKTSPFLFPGGSREMFFAEAQEGNGNARGVPTRRGPESGGRKSPRSPPLSLGAFAVGRGRAFRKIYKNKTV